MVGHLKPSHATYQLCPGENNPYIEIDDSINSRITQSKSTTMIQWPKVV